MQPLISIVILGCQGEHLLPLTFDSLVAQEEKNFEVILLDGSGQGGDWVQRIEAFPIRVQAARIEPISEVMNQGLLLARGTYVQFLSPGDRLLSQQATALLGRLAVETRHPDIVYCAFLQRNPDQPPGAVSFPLNRDFLRKGTGPSLLRGSYWILKSAIQELGGFDVRCLHRPLFDLLCRLQEREKTRAAFTRRVLIDADWRRKPPSELIGYVLDTCRILYRRFGFWHACRWLFVQDQRHLMRWAWKSIRDVFAGSP